MNKVKIKNDLNEKAKNTAIWDNTKKNGLQIFLKECNNEEVIISLLFGDIRYIGDIGDKKNLLCLNTVDYSTEIFSITKNGDIESFLRTSKYSFNNKPFANNPYIIDDKHYVWTAYSEENSNMTTLVCTDDKFNFLWEYAYNNRLASGLGIYPILNKGFLTFEEGNSIKFFNNSLELVWQYPLFEKNMGKLVFVSIEENNIEIYLEDTKILLSFEGEILDKQVFPYLFMGVTKSENFKYYKVLDNGKWYLLKENKKSKQKSKIDYVLPNGNGEFIIVDDYCFYQRQVGGQKCEFAIISNDKLSAMTIPSNIVIKPLITDENILLFLEPYFDEDDIFKRKEIVINKNGDVIAENEITLLGGDSCRYLCEIFKMNNTLYKIERREISEPKRKSDMMFWQFIISPL